MSFCIGGLPGGNLWSLASCKLCYITVAEDTVTGGTCGVKRYACVCASGCDGSGSCRVNYRGSRELKFDGDDEYRRSPAVRAEFVSVSLLYSVKCGRGRAAVIRGHCGYSGYDGLDVVGALYMLSEGCMSS